LEIKLSQIVSWDSNDYAQFLKYLSTVPVRLFFNGMFDEIRSNVISFQYKIEQLIQMYSNIITNVRHFKFCYICRY